MKPFLAAWASAAILSTASGWAKDPAPSLTPEVFAFGEKPGTGKPLARAEPIDLEMARGESEDFTIQLPNGKAGLPLTEAHLEWTGGAPAANLSVALLGAHALKASSFRARPPAGETFDVVLPNTWVALAQAKMPVSHLAKNPTYLLEVTVPMDASPGSFQGKLLFRHEGKNYSRGVRLRIHSYALPKAFRLKTSFGFSPWPVLSKHYGKWNEAELALYDQYFDLASQNRIDLHKGYVKFPDPGAEDPLSQAAVEKQSFLGQIGPRLAPEAKLPWGVTDLPVPEDYKTPGQGKISEGAVKLFWEKLNASVKKHGLTAKTYVYFVDEPKPQDLKGLASNLRKIRKWAPDLRFFSTTPYRPSLEGTFNLWGINLFLWEKPGEPSPESYVERARKGQAFWFYVGCNSHGCTGAENIENPDLVMDRSSAYQRVLPWMALRYGAEGILYYDTVYGYDHGGEDAPWNDGFEFTGYGEGNLFYPCTPKWGGCSTPHPLASVRLKILRDGLEDVEILDAARAQGAPIDAWVKELIPHSRSFPKTTSAYEELKRRALRSLDPQAAPTPSPTSP